MKTCILFVSLFALLALAESRGIGKGSCGVSSYLSSFLSGRIVGGSQVGKCSDIPWQVRILLGDSLCGGSILDKRTILTAAHCTHGKNPGQIKVLAGSISLWGGNREAKEHLVNQILQHESYDTGNKDSDIAILKLSSDIDLSGPCAQTICLNPNPVYDGSLCIVSGWGTTDWQGDVSQVLKMVDVKAMKGDNSMCKGKYKNVNATNVVCAYNVDKDSCQGDSGGPLVCKQPRSGSFAQVGVVSFGRECALRGYPGVYANVEAYYNWIKQRMEY